MHPTKSKGDLAVAKVIADLADHGISVCIPVSEHLAFDLVAVNDDEVLSRVQVKYCSVIDGKIIIPCTRAFINREGVQISRFDKNKFDAYAVYCPNTNKVYYLDIDDFLEYDKSISLRIELPKNNQIIGVTMADKYLNPLVIF